MGRCPYTTQAVRYIKNQATVLVARFVYIVSYHFCNLAVQKYHVVFDNISLNQGLNITCEANITARRHQLPCLYPHTTGRYELFQSLSHPLGLLLASQYILRLVQLRNA